MRPCLTLASSSPRRREILFQMGISFDVKIVPVQELDQQCAPHLPPAELAVENARLKARAVAGQGNPLQWILGADTIVHLEGRILGKPATNAIAGEYLRSLSGKTHEVITGLCLLDPEQREHCWSETTAVKFKILSEEAIQEYLQNVSVLDKAGGYALQEKGEILIEEVIGSATNVIGLPQESLKSVFEKFELR